MTEVKLLNPVGPFFSTQRLWYILSAALFLPLGAGVIISGSGSLLLGAGVLTAALGGGCLMAWKRKSKPVLDSNLLFQSLLVWAILPGTTPVLLGVVAGFLLLGIRRLVGRSPWINPVLLVWLAIFFSWSPGTSGAPDANAGASPLQNVKTALLESPDKTGAPMESAAMERTSFDQNTTDWLNNHVFGVFNVNLPGGYLDLVFGHHPGALGELSGFFILVASIFLLAFRLISWEIPLVYFFSHGIAIWLFGGLPFQTGLFTGDVLFYCFSGSFILSVFFLATDFSTSPLTRKGRLAYGLAAGLLVTALRLGSQFPEGTGFALLLMNFAVPLLDRGFTKKYS